MKRDRTQREALRGKLHMILGLLCQLLALSLCFVGVFFAYVGGVFCRSAAHISKAVKL